MTTNPIGLSTREEDSCNPPCLPIVSVIIPTYNESETIIELIQAIRSTIDDLFSTEIIIIDDNSPDNTARTVEEYAYRFYEGQNSQLQYDSNKLDLQRIFSITIVRRESKSGLISAVLEGVKKSLGKYILVLDADFSHPPLL